MPTTADNSSNNVSSGIPTVRHQKISELMAVIERLKARQASLSDTCSFLWGRLDGRNRENITHWREVAAAQTDLAEAQRQLASIRGRYAEATNRMEELRLQLVEREDERDALTHKIDALCQQVATGAAGMQQAKDALEGQLRDANTAHDLLLNQMSECRVRLDAVRSDAWDLTRLQDRLEAKEAELDVREASLNLKADGVEARDRFVAEAQRLREQPKDVIFKQERGTTMWWTLLGLSCPNGVRIGGALSKHSCRVNPSSQLESSVAMPFAHHACTSLSTASNTARHRLATSLDGSTSRAFSNSPIPVYRAIGLDPRNAGAWLLMSKELLPHGGAVVIDSLRYTKEQCLVKAITFDVVNVDAWLELGKLLSSSKGAAVIRDKSYTAQRCFEEVLGLSGDRPENDAPTAEVWMLLGESLLPSSNGRAEVKGKSYARSTCFQMATIADPKCAVGWWRLGAELFQDVVEPIDTCLVCIDKAIKLDPKLVCAWEAKGDMLAKIAHSPHQPVSSSCTAQECYETALGIWATSHDQLSARTAALWLKLGEMLDNGIATVDGKPVCKQDCYVRSLDLDNKSATAWLSLAKCLHRCPPASAVVVDAATMTFSQCYDKVLILDPSKAGEIQRTRIEEMKLKVKRALEQ